MTVASQWESTGRLCCSRGPTEEHYLFMVPTVEHTVQDSRVQAEVLGLHQQATSAGGFSTVNSEFFVKVLVSCKENPSEMVKSLSFTNIGK